MGMSNGSIVTFGFECEAIKMVADNKSGDQNILGSVMKVCMA